MKTRAFSNTLQTGRRAEPDVASHSHPHYDQHLGCHSIVEYNPDTPAAS